MESGYLLICIFAGLMLFIFACAFAYHKQSQEYLEALAADDEPKSKPDVGWKVQGDAPVQAIAAAKPPYQPQQLHTTLEIPQQSVPFPVPHTVDLQSLAQPKGAVPYPVRCPVPNLDGNSRSNGNQTYQPPSYESFQEKKDNKF